MRKLKPVIFSILKSDDFEKNLSKIHDLPGQKTINILFSFLCSAETEIKKRAVRAMGELVARIADEDLEGARGVMRRLIWSLNEESGWIGWGSAEAMGEIMARNDTLAHEYHNMLISYITEGDNYLLYDKLRAEVVVGLKRLAEVRPELVKEVDHLINGPKEN